MAAVILASVREGTYGNTPGHGRKKISLFIASRESQITSQESADLWNREPPLADKWHCRGQNQIMKLNYI